jgi:hypothetical protein
MDGVLRRALDGKKRGLTWRLQESLEDMEYTDYVCLVSHKYEHTRSVPKESSHIYISRTGRVALMKLGSQSEETYAKEIG